MYDNDVPEPVFKALVHFLIISNDTKDKKVDLTAYDIYLIPINKIKKRD